MAPAPPTGPSTRAPQKMQNWLFSESVCPQLTHVRGMTPTADMRELLLVALGAAAAPVCPEDFNGAPQKMQNAISALLASPHPGHLRE